MADDERQFQFTTPDGPTLTGFVRDSAAEDRRPRVLFTPGNGFPVQCYRPMLAALPADATVHALNHRGHGGSEVPERLDDWDALLADMRAYVEAQMAPPVILAGHSLGGMLALRLAAECPELSAGLLILEPPLRARRGRALPAEVEAASRAFIQRARERRNHWGSRDEAAAWFAGSVGYRLWDAEARAEFVRVGLVDTPDGAVTLATPPSLEAAIYEAVPRQELYTWAETARCPAVLLRGVDSAAVDVAALEELAELLPLAVLLPTPGTHTFPLEHPAETARLMETGLRLLRGETGLVTD